MKDKHLNKIGIKQLIRLEWLDRTLSLLLAGMSPEEIRRDLSDYLADKKPSGGIGERGYKTYTLAIAILSAWFDPAIQWHSLRDKLLVQARQLPPEEWMVLHWTLMLAAYPFWFNVAIQTGRVCALQERVTRKQIFDRLIERYGERSTILRYARYVIRSFKAWKILEDTETRGCYQKGASIPISNPQIMGLLFEAMLISTQGNKAPLRSLAYSPALFPFILATERAPQAVASNPALVGERLGDGEMMVYLQNDIDKDDLSKRIEHN
ncbi:MAG: hypothetical protein PHC50_02685 [Candidatus Cloacimonetes bacterium]|nr:hypothetical protein [Candidatus Cloacimonadota bacterium]